MTRLVQIKKGGLRRVALVDEPHLRFLDNVESVFELAQVAISRRTKLSEIVMQKVRQEAVSYDPVYKGDSEWRLLPPIDHPAESSRCLVSGTGLTHLGSARNRQAMHATATEALTDSMKMFQWGMEGGRPAPGEVGTAPEWFHKGTGTDLRAHGEALVIPPHAEDGGEEAEIAGVYIIGEQGDPYRIGMAGGNEFSDHQFERKNYLNLAGSKLRSCALGPELVVDPVFESLAVQVGIEHAGNRIWSKTFRTGEREMCHSLQNIEHHHFKFEGHRRPGDLHVHFFGTDYLSYSDGIRLQEGDVMQVAFEGFGRPLRNPVHVVNSKYNSIRTTPLG